MHDDLLRLPDGRLLQKRLITDPAGEAGRLMKSGNPQKGLMKIHPFQLLNGRKPNTL